MVRHHLCCRVVTHKLLTERDFLELHLVKAACPAKEHNENRYEANFHDDEGNNDLQVAKTRNKESPS